MISDWLELDASDSWVRHDSEIVRVLSFRASIFWTFLSRSFFFFQALQQELSYASYLNVHSAIFPPPRNRGQIAAYGRAINTCLSRTPYMQFSIRLPIYDPTIFQSPSPRSISGSPHDNPPTQPSSPCAPSTPVRSSEPRAVSSTRASEAELNATWEMWDAIRSICAYNPRLTLSAYLLAEFGVWGCA
jgi:type II protein arginine methyltransferase